MKSHLRVTLLACGLALSALSLTACGGGDDDGGGGNGEEGAIVDVITEAAVEEKPEFCGELLTLNFNEQTQKVTGKEAVEECEAEAEEEDGADSVDVTNVQIEGGGAEADVAFSGGDLDGQTLTIALVEEDGQWKLDEIAGFAEFDRETLLGGLREGLEEGLEGDEAAEAECIVEGIEELDDEGLEELFLAPNFDTLTEIAEAC